MPKNRISISNTDNYTTDIISRGHTLVSDEPVEYGGKDKGMTPYELFLSALGSCKAITMRMYAQRKNIPLKNILINLNLERIHADDCLDCDTKDDKIDKIDVEIELTGELTSEEKNNLIEISEKCPVHKTLTSRTDIITKLIAK